MSPKNDNREPSAGPDVTVQIPHGDLQAPPATAPSLPPLPPLEPLPTRPIIIADNPRTPLPPEPKVPTPPLPPQPTPALPPIEEFHQRHDRHWSAILLYVGLALVVAIAVVFGGRWIYRQTSNHKPTTPQPAPADTNKVPAQPGESSQNPNSGPGSTTVQTVPTTTTTTQLPNSGPGDIIAIFVGTAFGVGALHYIYTLRRQR